MNEPYQVVLDIWEANDDLIYDTLNAYNVTGIIVRLNDMAGGHHMDERFVVSWEAAKQLPCRAVYFVYNPWVSGAVNYSWLYTHLPANFNSRLFVDIEVKYPNYSSVTYSKEVAEFITMCKATWPTTIYTGAWFLSTLSAWPTNVDYWWGAYPNSLNTGETISWFDFRKRLDIFKFAYNGSVCPGGINNIKMWQCSGGGVFMPGFGGHKVDVNVVPGTLNDLKKWLGPFGQPLHVVPIEPTYNLALVDNMKAIAGQLATISIDLTVMAETLRTSELINSNAWEEHSKLISSNK